MNTTYSTNRIRLLAGIAAIAVLPAPALAADETVVAAEADAFAADDQAQEPGRPAASSSGAPENVIIITARRREEAAQDVPLAISTLDARTINETGNFSVYKLQQLAPTLQVYSSNPRNTVVNIRGLGVPFGLTNDGFEQGVGIYVDDVYNARVASATFDFLDVAQVEILRGPQGTLYGKNTTAGAINIRTNQPTFTFEGSAEASIGSYNFHQFKTAVSGPLSDNVAVRLAASGTSRRGTVYNVTSGNWINEQDNLGFRGQVLFRLGDTVDLTFAGDISLQDPECCGGVYVGYGPTQRAAARQYPALAAFFPGYTTPGANLNSLPSTDPFDRRTNIDATLNAGNDIGGVSARLAWDIDDNNAFTSISAWRFWDWRPENDRDFTGLSIVSKSQNPSQQEQYSQEFRFNHSGERLNFVLGAFGFYQRIDTQGLEQQGPDASRWNLTNAAQITANILNGLRAENTQFLKSTSFALFGQLDFALTDRLTIQPGARVNYDKKEGFYERRVFRGNGTELLLTDTDAVSVAQRGIYAPLSYAPEYSAWNFSYDLTVSYELADDVLLYGTYAKTFKTGGINQNGVPVDGNNNPIVSAYSIEPESVNHFEGGVKTQFWDRRATLNLAAFRTTIDDFQANVTNGQFGVLRGYLANAGQVRSQGVEVDFSVRPSERFTAYVNGAFTDAKYTEFTDAPCPPEFAGGTTVGAGQTPGAPGVPGLSPANCDISGQVLPGVSKWAFSVGGEANSPATIFDKEGQVYFGVDTSYRSEWSSNPSPSIYTFVDGYALVNLRLGFRGDNFNIYGWVRNAFDAEYYDQLNFGPSNTGLIAGNLGDPRTYGGTVRFDF
ncbi:MAG: TonB-dependent receptor [Sphingomonadales bacterium 12-68-11]|nr:MAG: TonB-dependent receptor [Sphingomonadales bacterium 12-68-11]